MSGPARPLAWTRSRHGMRRAFAGEHVYTAWTTDYGRRLLDLDGYEIGWYDTWAEVEARVREETGRG